MAIFLLLFFLLMVGYGFLIDAYRRAWNALPEYELSGADINIALSVIVAVRNEANNLANLWESLLGQDYPRKNFEVILVDDHSTDRSWEVLEGCREEGLQVIKLRLPKGVASKKRALELGIGRASGELIVTTDADCVHHASWLKTIASFYHSSGSRFIAAPVGMSGKNTFLNIFQMLDVLTLQGITGAAVSKQTHALCNGANLAYPKQLFNEVGGFTNIDHIPSGDDLLLMQKVMEKQADTISYLKARSAIVETRPEKSWSDLINQRIRWASKAVHYRDKTIFRVLLVTYLVNCCFIVLLAACFFSPNWLGFLLLFFLAKIIIEFPFVNAVAGFFGQQRLMKYFVIMQPVHIVYTIVAGWLGRFGSYQWKARRIKNLKKTAG